MLSRQVLRSDVEEPCDQRRRFLPAPCFGLKLPASGRRQSVEARSTVVIGRPPLGGDGTFLLESQEQRVQRPLINRECIVADLFDAFGQSVAVLRSEDVEGFEYHQRERALLDFLLPAHVTSFWFPK